MTVERPPTVAAILREAADQFPLLDQSVKFMADVFGQPAPEHTPGIEGDLRMLAAWFDAHPELDAQAWVLLDAMEPTS